MIKAKEIKAAIAGAKKYVSWPERRSNTEYVVYGLWDVEKLKGATAEFRARNYPEALARRRYRIAQIALASMGKYNYDAIYALNQLVEKGYASIEELVRAGLRACENQNT